jgi:hypothetical protein
MMRTCTGRGWIVVTAAALAALVGACRGPLDEAVFPTLADINTIRNDTSLTSQEQRAALTDLGLSPATVNGLMRGVRTANQDGGDLRTAYDKVVGDHLDEMTPDEVQLYGDAASSTGAKNSYTLSDTEAQAIVSFFRDNGIATKDQLLLFLDDPANELTMSSDIPSGALDDLFVTFDTNLLISELP